MAITNIVVVTGSAGSGKDTVAEMLQQVHTECVNVKFATAVVEVTSALFNIDSNLLATQEGKKEYYPTWEATGRELLQYVGTDLVRNNLDSDHWVKLVSDKLIELAADNKQHVLLFTDCRFHNEAEFISKLAESYMSELHHIKVNRKAVTTLRKEEAKHESEQEIEQLIFPNATSVSLINNDYSMRTLEIDVLAKARLIFDYYGEAPGS
jgi:hypothetical protein